MASLGQLLCGLSSTQWLSLLPAAVFADTLTSYLARLDCSLPDRVRSHLASLLLDMYGPTSTWTASDLLSSGWVASALAPRSASSFLLLALL